MGVPTDRCLIWEEEYPANVSTDPNSRVMTVYDSPRADGSYKVTYHMVLDDVHRFSYLSQEQKAWLTTWLIEQRQKGNDIPIVTKEIVEYIIAKGPLAVHERADGLLRFIARQSETVAHRISVFDDTLGAYAWTESTVWDEVDYYLDYLMSMGWIAGERVGGGNFVGTITIAGYNRIADLRTNADSSQAFVAMWFNDRIVSAYDDGIEAGVLDAGFKPIRIDRKDHVNKIEDEIIAEIRRSRFLVADFTHDKDGARGGVYYEAGFAHGLGLPVIFTCHEDSMETLHFDTAHYSHIVWAEPKDLREKLKNRILAVIGQGPEQATTPSL